MIGEKEITFEVQKDDHMIMSTSTPTLTKFSPLNLAGFDMVHICDSLVFVPCVPTLRGSMQSRIQIISYRNSLGRILTRK